MLKKLKKQDSGFTIIEVMIVLAIAGLIILIVLLAVPALQRNARNTAIKNDASAVVAAVSTYESDNDGAKVTSISNNGLVQGSGGASSQAKLQGSTVVNSTTGVPATVVTHGTISYRLGFNCQGNSSARAVSVYYSVETSGAESIAANNKCVDG